MPLKFEINYIAKLIDFGTTDKNIRKPDIVKDLNRFFSLLKQVYNNQKVDYSLNLIDEWKYSGQDRLDFLKTLINFFLE